MNAGEMWDVRLPDGRGLRAVTTETICEYLRAGRLPREALVRRAGHDDWTTLDWVPEFAALLAERPPPATPAASKTSPGPRTRQGPQDDPTATVTSRLETTHLGALGVPVILREVVTALDLTLLPNKLRLLAVLGLLAGLLVTLPALVWAPPTGFSGFNSAVPSCCWPSAVSLSVNSPTPSWHATDGLAGRTRERESLAEPCDWRSACSSFRALAQLS